MTSAQLAARAMLDWSQTRLAQEAGVSVETIKRLERMGGALEATKVATLEAIKKTLAKAGVGPRTMKNWHQAIHSDERRDPGLVVRHHLGPGHH